MRNWKTFYVMENLFSAFDFFIARSLTSWHHHRLTWPARVRFSPAASIWGFRHHKLNEQFLLIGSTFRVFFKRLVFRRKTFGGRPCSRFNLHHLYHHLQLGLVCVSTWDDFLLRLLTDAIVAGSLKMKWITGALIAASVGSSSEFTSRFRNALCNWDWRGTATN